MPATPTTPEYCVECNVDNNRNNYTLHNGTGCRWSRCASHCTCPRESREEWRTILRSNISRMRTRCGNCNNLTTHTCLQSQQEQDGTRFSINSRRCARCCLNLRCGLNNQAGVEQGTRLSCETRLVVEGTTIVHCDNCNRTHTREWYRNDSSICRLCSNYPCRRCSRLRPRVSNDNGEDSPAELICGDCGCCTTGTHFPGADEVTRRCCRCTPSTRPRLHSTVITFTHVDTAHTGRTNPLRRAIGVELEIAGFREPSKEALETLYNTCVAWHANIGTDGSVSSDYGNSVEIRTAPASGTRFVRQMREIITAIRGANGFVNNSCGLHVHVDMRDVVGLETTRGNVSPLSLPTLDALVHTWLRTEETFFAMVNDYRRGKQHCRPMRSYLPAPPPGQLHGPYDSYSGAMQRCERYCALNIASAIAAHRTVEFRLHEGSVGRKKVVAWALLCASFVETVVTAARTDTIDSMYATLTELGPVEWLRRIAPTEDARAYVTWKRDHPERQAA